MVHVMSSNINDQYKYQIKKDYTYWMKCVHVFIVRVLIHLSLRTQGGTWLAG